MQIIENEKVKILKSLHYNYVFDKNSGFFARWGATEDEDPDFSPFGPEIADIEISSANASDIENKTDNMLITEGGCPGACKKCYKSNHGKQTIHMSLDTLKKILDKMPNVLQVAYGITGVDSHPQLFDILWETRNREIVPNITIIPVNVTDEHCKKLSEVCGAVAVSIDDRFKEAGYNVIKKLSQDYGMSQINIHIVLAEDTIPFIKEVIEDMKSDNRLSSMNALVMLSFKDKANTNCYKPITQSSYNGLVEFCEEMGIRFGFDSCGSKLYLEHIKGKENEANLSRCVEPCESLLYSCYIAHNGKMTCCSFLEGIEEEINILDYDNIIDVWYSEKAKRWRNKLLQNKRNCPIYQIG
jgi:hypothetical protein